jgi:hypothetical protein
MIELQVQPLGRDQREPGLQIEPQLPAKDAQRPRAGPVLLPRAMVEDVLQ